MKHGSLAYCLHKCTNEVCIIVYGKLVHLCRKGYNYILMSSEILKNKPLHISTLDLKKSDEFNKI